MVGNSTPFRNPLSLCRRCMRENQGTCLKQQCRQFMEIEDGSNAPAIAMSTLLSIRACPLDEPGEAAPQPLPVCGRDIPSIRRRASGAGVSRRDVLHAQGGPR